MLTTVIAAVAAFLGAASLVLHFVAPRTANTFDDKLEEFVDEALALLGSKGADGEPSDEVKPNDAKVAV